MTDTMRRCGLVSSVFSQWGKHMFWDLVSNTKLKSISLPNKIAQLKSSCHTYTLTKAYTHRYKDSVNVQCDMLINSIHWLSLLIVN